MSTPGNESLIAGAYTVTVNGVSLGLMQGDANVPTIEQTTASEDINNTNIYGKSTIESFYLGANWFASMVCMEYKAGPISNWWPWGTGIGQMGTISGTFTGSGLALVLTAVTGTPAQIAGAPNTVTSNLSILAPGFNTRLLYGPQLRTVPLRFQLYPYTHSGSVVWIVQT